MDADHPPAPRTARALPTANFHTTHWSVVLAARDSATPDGQEALATLCQDYWFPLYAYVRGCGFSPEDAQDVTQAFFARFVAKEALGHVDRERGRFRWFLLKSFQNFLRNEISRGQAQKRGGGWTQVSWDSLEAENRFQAEPADHATPDVLFDRRWARAAMGRAYDQLAAEFSANGRAILFQQLKKYLAGNASGGSYGEVAARFGLSTSAVKVTVHRLRQRYRELVRSEIARTVANPDDVDDELRHLAQLIAS